MKTQTITLEEHLQKLGKNEDSAGVSDLHTNRFWQEMERKKGLSSSEMHQEANSILEKEIEEMVNAMKDKSRKAREFPAIESAEKITIFSDALEKAKQSKEKLIDYYRAGFVSKVLAPFEIVDRAIGVQLPHDLKPNSYYGDSWTSAYYRIMNLPAASCGVSL